MAEVEPLKVEDDESTSSTHEVTVELSQVSTPECSRTDTRSSTPETALIDSQVSTFAEVKNCEVSTPDEITALDSSISENKIVESKILTTVDNPESRVNANGVVKNTEIIEAVEDS